MSSDSLFTPFSHESQPVVQYWSDPRKNTITHFQPGDHSALAVHTQVLESVVTEYRPPIDLSGRLFGRINSIHCTLNVSNVPADESNGDVVLEQSITILDNGAKYFWHHETQL